MEKTLYAAVYIRVSTDDQLDLSPESQLEEIRKYAKNNNIYIKEEYVFKELEGISGRKAEKRPAFQTMISTAKMKPQPFDVILVWKFSRFARNQDESTYYKSILRKKCGVDIISVSEPIMEGMYGRLIEMIIEWQDEFYSYNLGVEVRRSMKLKAEKGLYNAQPPFGYNHVKGGIPTVNNEQAAIVRTIFDMYVNGEDKSAIIQYLNSNGIKTTRGNTWNPENVSYVLDNPFYIGKIRWNRRLSSSSSSLKDKSEWIVTDSHHEPIIDMDTWERAQRKTEIRKSIHERYQHHGNHQKHWLSGILKCSVCGSSLGWKSGYGRTNNTFQCTGYRHGAHSESQCISENIVVAAVIKSLEQVLNTEDAEYTIINTNIENNVELTIYQEELKRMNERIKRIKAAYMDGIDTLEEYKQNKESLENRVAKLQHKIHSITDITLSNEQIKDKFLHNVQTALDVINSDAEYPRKAEAIRSIVKTITFYKKTKTLVFHYFVAI